MSEIKVNKISPRTNCGTTQLGDSGDTFTIPAGATITNNGTANGFGATGAVNWQTTVKTSGFTATAGEGYFVDTTSGAISVNLPAGTPGAVVGFSDYAQTFDTNACTLVQNGSDKIAGDTVNAELQTEGIAVTLVFVDSTKGWIVTDSGLQSDAPNPTFITATGGTVTTVCTNFKVHTFTGPGTFTVCSVGNSAGSNTVDYLVVAGGGGGGSNGGGGGAGGYRFTNGTASGCFTTAPAPLAPLGVSALPVSAQGYPIVVGGGGATPGPSPFASHTGGSGQTSSFAGISSAGGGGGGSQNGGFQIGGNGGSGGGGGQADDPSPCGGYSGGNNQGTGNTPPVSPPQGNPGGRGSTHCTQGAGGGGGAGAVGSNANPTGSPATPSTGGAGGAGITSCITGSPVARGGGGGGSGAAGQGAGGAGGGGAAANPGPGVAGTANTGGGGGGSHPTSHQGNTGGSGIVIIRYRFQ